MFESLKKKFSRTSDKLEEELIEEAQEENNLEEESGKKFSFFSFGRKDKKEEEDSKSDVAEIPQEVESIQETDTSDDETSDDKDEKSGFWSFGKKSSDNKEEPQEEEESAEEIQEEEEPKKSHFWSRNKRKTLKNQKMPMKKQKRKNPVSGAEIKIMILLKKMMKMKNQAECFHLLLPKPFQKNTLKIFYGNLKWVFWKGTWLWK